MGVDKAVGLNLQAALLVLCNVQIQEEQMAGYLVGHIKVKDPALWQDYVAGVQESLAPFAAKVVFRGKLASILAGTHEHDFVVVIEFVDLATLDRWFHSATYQALIPLRDRAADVVITSYEG